MNKYIYGCIKMANYEIAKLKSKKGIYLNEDNQFFFAKKEYETVDCLCPFFGFVGGERIPDNVLNQYGNRIKRLNSFLAGRTIGFITDAERIVFRIVYKDIILPANMSIIGASGIDVYLSDGKKWKWHHSIFPKNQFEMGAEKGVDFPAGEKQVLIYLPSYASIDSMSITIKKGTTLKKWESTFSPQGEISFYGSSITQGCAASRPGLTYPNLLGRMLNMAVANFGYSESALGQERIIEYLASRHSSIYVVEYDHNATVEHLRKSYHNVYSMIRRQNTDALIVLISRLSGGMSIDIAEENERTAILQDTYERGLADNDRNLIYLCGRNRFSPQDDFFSDDRHPNDRGMYMLAKMIADRIEHHITSGE